MTSHPFGSARSIASRAMIVEGVLLAAGSLFALVCSGVVCFGYESEWLARRIPDDSFFYFQIAANFPSTLRFSYDGLHDTYGFQPLWQIVLCALAPFFSSRDLFLRAGCMLLGLLHVATGFQLYRLLRRTTGSVAGLAAAGFWLVNPGLLNWTLGGKENVLYALILVSLLLHLDEFHFARRVDEARGVVLGLLAALLYLARVNALGFIALIAAALALRALFGDRARRVDRVRALAVASLSGMAVAGPWLAYAWLVLGGLVPTSGVLKLRFAELHVVHELGLGWMSPAHIARTLAEWPAYLGRLALPMSQPFLLLFIVLGVAALASAAERASRPRARGLCAPRVLARRFAVLALLAAWALANSFLNLLTLPNYVGYGTWYAAPEALCIATAFGLLAGSVARAGAGGGACPYSLRSLRRRVCSTEEPHSTVC